MWLEQKYVSLISPRLELFKKISDNVWNFRCPYCGDSKKNRRKARGYLFNYKNSIMFKCWNCNLSHGLKQFLQDQDNRLYNEFLYEKIGYVDENQIEIASPIVKKEQSAFTHFSKSPLSKLEKISSLHHTHPARMYVDERKIPPRFHYKLYYAPNYKEWVNSFIPNKFSNTSIADSRLVIPMLDSEKRFIGCTGRSINKNEKVRYISAVVSEESERLFGLDDLDRSKPMYVTEGAIDSYFIENCVGLGGTNFINFQPNKDETTIIIDNDPRNKEVVNRLHQLILENYKVFIWPQNLNDVKDINEWFLKCGSTADIKLTVDANTFSGLTALAKWMQWKKI